MTKTNKKTITKYAKISGISLLIMTVISLVIFASLQVNYFSILSIFGIIVLDIIVAWGLYLLLKSANKILALTMAILRTVYAVVFLHALSQIGYLNSFYYFWERSLIIFGLHLFVLGIILLQAKYIPKYLGYLIIFTSVGYLVDSLGKFLGYTTNLTMLTFWGEIFLGFWLAFRFGKQKVK